MNHQEKLNSFKNSCTSTYPSLKNYDFKNSLNLVADFSISISKKANQQIQNFIKTIFSVSRKPEYRKFIVDKFPAYESLIGAHNYSVLMSYDFHIDHNETAKLIEVNTNASSYFVGNEIYKVLSSTDHTQSMKEAFTNEFSKHSHPVKNIVIIDENPKEQFMYLEFLMFKDLFIKWGYKCSILDYREVGYKNSKLIDKDGTPIDFIYNRYCDFDLSDDSSKNLLNAYINNECIFSPNPKEYLLLADKNRMVEWSNNSWREKLKLKDEELSILNETLIQSKPINQFDADELWKNKKDYFFKPTQSFGGKSVYRGKGITKKTYERLLTTDTLVQEFVPAPTISINDTKWKYDLRVYAYKDQAHYTLARVYQGQVTNLQTLGGGLAMVSID